MQVGALGWGAPKGLVQSRTLGSGAPSPPRDFDQVCVQQVPKRRQGGGRGADAGPAGQWAWLRGEAWPPSGRPGLPAAPAPPCQWDGPPQRCEDNRQPCTELPLHRGWGCPPPWRSGQGAEGGWVLGGSLRPATVCKSGATAQAPSMSRPQGLKHRVWVWPHVGPNRGPSLRPGPSRQPGLCVGCGWAPPGRGCPTPNPPASELGVRACTPVRARANVSCVCVSARRAPARGGASPGGACRQSPGSSALASGHQSAVVARPVSSAHGGSGGGAPSSELVLSWSLPGLGSPWDAPTSPARPPSYPPPPPAQGAWGSGLRGLATGTQGGRG